MKRGHSTSDINTGIPASDVDFEGTATSDENNPVINRKKKSKSAAATTTTASTSASVAASIQSSLFDDAIESVLSQSNDTSTSSDSVADLKMIINNLTTTVNHQQAAIDNLVCRLNFVLSFIGISSDDVDPKSTTHTLLHSVDSVTSNANTTVTPTEDMQPVPVPVPFDPESYAAVTSHGIPPPSTQRSTCFKDVILSTIYKEKIENERRSNSIIVSGIVSESNHTDKEIIESLIHSEFCFNSVVTTVKRLCKVLEGRVQPLLVAVTYVDVAKS